MSAEEERARIVAWLRSDARALIEMSFLRAVKIGSRRAGVWFAIRCWLASRWMGHFVAGAANAIESGAHLSALDQEGGAK